MTTLFISDLHLDPSRPATVRAFFDFLLEDAVDADALYILGDFFEAWIGDDNDSELAQSVSKALYQLSLTNTPIYIQHGNRDFLLGDLFCSMSGCTLLPDPYIVELYGKPVLLMHGDSLCTDDTKYMELRSMLRSQAWQTQFLSQSIEQRNHVAQQLRSASKKANSNKPEDIMDVNTTAVEDAFKSDTADLLIHGHTHRPNIHDHLINNRVVKRVVLGDWDDYAWALQYQPDHSFQLKKWPILDL